MFPREEQKVNPSVAGEELSWEFWLVIWLMIHIAGMIFALTSFWVPFVTVKGGHRHIRAGQIFLCGVLMATVSTAVLSMMTLNDPLSRDEIAQQALFSLYTAFFTICTAWHGFRLIYPPEKMAIYQWRVEKILAGLLIAVSCCSAAIFMLNGKILSLLPIFGIGLGVSQWRDWKFLGHNTAFKHMCNMAASGFGIWLLALFETLPRTVGITLKPILLWIFTPAISLFLLIEYWRRHTEHQNRD